MRKTVPFYVLLDEENGPCILYVDCPANMGEQALPYSLQLIN